MKQTIKTVYVITALDKEQEKETLEQAIETKQFLEEFLNISCLIEERQKTVYEIEKGDKVSWINTNRIDIVTGIVEDAWGDRRYQTKELNGDKIGLAYEKDLSLAI